MKTVQELNEIARSVRIDALKGIYAAGAGHPGGSFSVTDILVSLYFNVMNVDPEDPKMENRDRLVLSKGHAAPALYATLAHRGFFDPAELLTLRRIGSRLQGHPYFSLPGVEIASGSLGQGLSFACGMAMALKLDNNPANVFVMLGDGEMQEGNVWEALMQGAHRNLDNLIAIVDRNMLQIDGNTEDVMALGDLSEKLRAFGWNVIEIDGHNINDIYNSIETAKSAKAPAVIVAKTIKGKGVSFMENNPGWHGTAPKEQDYLKAIEELK